jgi:NAD(P)-dependent dehydrogenase (short-subunit alcohol dehydrogenase family)
VPRGTALVTGAAKRIGRVIALSLAEAGYDVAVHHRSSSDEAADAVREIEALGRRAAAFPADLSVEAEAAALVSQAAEALGPVTLLVNNASVFDDDRIETVTQQSWHAHMQTNLRAPVILIQAFAAALPGDREGLVVNILDQRVRRLNPQFFSYTLSKAALWTATQTLAQALAPRIRVNGVGPGPTLPSVHQQNGEFNAEAAAIPLERHVTPEEIASAIRFLIEARSVTGQMIAVDGGQHLAWRTPDVVGA